MLIGNHSVLNKSHAFFTNGTATAGAYAANTRSNWLNPSYANQRRFSIAPKTSFPEGYNLDEAYFGAWKSGGLASQTRIDGSATFTADGLRVKLSDGSLAGSGSISNASLGLIVQGVSTLTGTGAVGTADLLATSSLVAALSGTGAINTANLSALVPLASTLAGSSSISTANLKGTGSLSANIEVGAAQDLTAGDIWTYDISAISTAGTAGKKLNDASSGSNPWDAMLVNHTTSGTFGWFIQKLLTVAKFIGLK